MKVSFQKDEQGLCMEDWFRRRRVERTVCSNYPRLLDGWVRCWGSAGGKSSENGNEVSIQRMFAWRLTDDSNSSHKCGTYYTSKYFMHIHTFNSFMSMRWILWRGNRGTEDLRNLPGLHRELAIELRDEPSQSESIASTLTQCSIYKYSIYTGLHGK